MGDTKGYERFDRHADDWHEWSIGTGEAIDKGKPSRLFVRTGEGLVVLVHANVTSFAPTARELEGDGGKAERIILSRADARFLLKVLPRALAELAAEDAELPQCIECGARHAALPRCPHV